MSLVKAGTKNTAVMAGHDRVRWNVTLYDGQRPCERRAADARASEDDAAGCDPRTALDHDGAGDEGHVSAVSMAPGREEGLLGDDHVVTEHDLVLVVDPDAFSHPGAVADCQFPGELHPCAG